MATAITYFDESTINKVYTALHGNNDLDFPTVLAAVSRMQNAGILFREELPEDMRASRKTGPRNKSEQDNVDLAEKLVQDGIVSVPDGSL